MSMTIGIYFDIHIDTEEEVLKIRAKAMELMRQGIVTMTWGGEGVNASKQFTAPVLDILAESRFFLKSLNPTKYGYLTNSSRQIRI